MKKHRKCKKIIAFVTVLFIAFVAVIGLHKTGIYRFDFLKDIYKKIDFQLSTNELNIPQDALSFSVYDIEQEEGMKTGTMASSYNIVVLYEKDGKAYLITCLAAHSNEGRYKAVQSAINTIIE